MCYGCIPVLPMEGGANEYAVHNINAIIVDTKDNKNVIESIYKIIKEDGKIQSMQKEAIATARRYSVLPASWSELQVLNRQYK
ncbi:hypothetical protein IMSAGC009_01087 [Lachnospiraceae bacterium]|nr:hypothetical protein IMSAGC009_01087 [Lachnospiraceae bacterium]